MHGIICLKMLYTQDRSYKRLRNVVTLKLRKEKQRYFNEQLRETKGESRGTWKNLKQPLGNGSKSSGAAARTANETKDKYNIFNRVFVTCAGDLRLTHRSSTRSFFKWLPQIDRPEKSKLKRSLYRTGSRGDVIVVRTSKPVENLGKKLVILIALQFRYTFYRPQTKRLRARKIGLQYKIRKGRKQIWGRFSNP